MSHILVIANETAASKALLDALRDKSTSEDRFTVIAPVNEPASGYTLYEGTRRGRGPLVRSRCGDGAGRGLCRRRGHAPRRRRPTARKDTDGAARRGVRSAGL